MLFWGGASCAWGMQGDATSIQTKEGGTLLRECCLIRYVTYGLQLGGLAGGAVPQGLLLLHLFGSPTLQWWSAPKRSLVFQKGCLGKQVSTMFRHCDEIMG